MYIWKQIQKLNDENCIGADIRTVEIRDSQNPSILVEVFDPFDIFDRCQTVASKVNFFRDWTAGSDKYFDVVCTWFIIRLYHFELIVFDWKWSGASYVDLVGNDRHNRVQNSNCKVEWLALNRVILCIVHHSDDLCLSYTDLLRSLSGAKGNIILILCG